VLHHVIAEFQVDHAGLHHRAQIGQIDFQNFVHARRGEHDRMAQGDRPAAQPGARTAWHHRDLVLGAEAHYP
jgi:hypothetical protein